ncbi:TIM barrel protein [candidate division KSB1 bacterium]|nr:TIM barrel protein [candidate division KSB1 bacterium]
MRRREFMKTGLVAGVTALTASPVSALGAQMETTPRDGKHTFKHKYAPHFGMFKNHAGEDFIDQLRFMADQGFTALEDNEMRTRPKEVQEKIGKDMARLGMTMGVFVANSNGFGQPSFTSGDADMRAKFLSDCRDSVEVAKRVNAKWMTVVMGDLHPKLEMGYQTANAIESLKRAAEIFAPHGLIMVIEPLNPYRDHPGMFLSKIPQAYMICKAVGSPACKILFDIYHQQITEGNLIPNMNHAWDEIAYFQIGDNPGRKEPTTGEINYRNVFKHIYEKGYRGVMGMEHGNSKTGKEGELAVIEAYKACDAFLS